MEARLLHGALVVAAILSTGAGYRAQTENFVVTASSPAFAEQVAGEAERLRAALAEQWLGQTLPKWSEPCPIRVIDGPGMGAGGATSFYFDQGQAAGWTMEIQGSQERILDSVLPHEITHTVFATHFGQPLPRWADEGACTTVEHPSEKRKHQQMLIQFLRTHRGIPFNRMFSMREYPQDIMPLYAQGFSVARFLIAQRGERAYIRFLEDGLQRNDWHGAIERHYGYDDLSELQLTWVEWIKCGSPLVASGLAMEFRGSRLRDRADDGTEFISTPAGQDLTPVEPRESLPASSAGNWYLQQRDKARSERMSTARPQPIGRPQPQVLVR